MCRVLVSCVLWLLKRNIKSDHRSLYLLSAGYKPAGTRTRRNETRGNGRSGKDVRAVRKRTSEVRNRTDSWC